MRLISLDGCKLKIGSYPEFSYNASGGGGEASIVFDEKRNITLIKFNPDTFQIPDLDNKSTRFLGLPLPLGIKVQMVMKKLEGSLNNENGHIKLNYESRFFLKIWPKFIFPPLIIKTVLQSNKSNTLENKIETLESLAIVEPTSNFFLNSFLSLPNNAKAILKCKLINI